MKIAIIGTRGIPNNYGGFEQFAQYISLELVKHGNEVTVYNPSYRKEKESIWNGVRLKSIYCPIFFKSLGQIIYDYLSIKNAIKEQADIILVCGYVSSFLALVRFYKHKTKIAVHMDGWEWKRKKWNILIRKIILITENQVVKRMPYLITDHPILSEYYNKKYNKNVFEIAYGCDIVEVMSQNIEFERPFFLMIARNEKENNISLVCQAFIESGINANLYVFTNKKIKYQSPKIKWFKDEYNESILNYYRSKALAYIHAYTVGGTNPSLLESMAYCKTIIAFDNDFHRLILQENALYFKTKEELIGQINLLIHDNNLHLHINANRIKILNDYQWPTVANKYLALFKIMTNEQILDK